MSILPRTKPAGELVTSGQVLAYVTKRRPLGTQRLAAHNPKPHFVNPCLLRLIEFSAKLINEPLNLGFVLRRFGNFDGFVFCQDRGASAIGRAKY